MMSKKNLMKLEKRTMLDPVAYLAGGAVIVILVIVFLFQYLVSTPALQSKNNLDWYRRLLYFDYMFILFASGAAIILGCILVSLGYEKTKFLGVGFLLGGSAFFLIGFYYFDVIFNRPQLPSNVNEALIAVIATIFGLLLALAVAFIITVSMRKTVE